MFLLKLFYPTLTGIVIFGAQMLDEHTSVPLYTTASVVMTLLIFTWTVSRKIQVFIDRLKEVEKAGVETKSSLKEDIKQIRNDMAHKDDVATIKREIGEINETMTELKASAAWLNREVREFRTGSVADMAHLRSQMKAESMLEPIADETGLKILIVEDDPDDCELLVRKLTPTFIVDTAGSLSQCNAKIKKQMPDCVLLDLKLPDARYNRTVEDFVADNPNLLCIVLTGSGDENTSRLCFEQGAADVWVKGIDDTNVRVIARRLKEAIWRRLRQAKA